MDLSRVRVARAVAVIAAAGLLGGLVVTPVGVSAQGGVIKKVSEGKVKPAVVSAGGALRTPQSLSGGVLVAAHSVAGKDMRDEEADAANTNDTTEFAVTQGTLGCRTRNTNGNVRVNQDCTFRRQAEELIKINPNDPRNIIAGQNDSRIGYNHCGFDYSFDGGKHWGDGIPPFFQRENHPENDGPNAFNPNTNTLLGGLGTAHTYDAASDPALAFDADGRAFYSCIVFDVNTDANGVLVTQSPQGAGGSFYDNVAAGSVGASGPSASTKRFVVVEDNDAPPGDPRIVLHDKEFIAADTFASSPNKNNVYITWTVFKYRPDCTGGVPPQCESPIYGSMSTDHAVTWSTPEQISGRSKALCAAGNAFDATLPVDSCNNDQGSDPIVLPNGDVVVTFNNGNVPNTTNAQQLSVLCHPTGSSSAGTAKLNCASPVKVGNDITAGEPQCDFGRGPEECIPGPWIRTNDFPRIGRDGSNNSLYAVWQDYRNNEFDIQISRSTNGGKSWTEGGTLNPGRGSDHYMPAIDVGSGHLVATSYYKSDRVPNENASPPDGFTPGRDAGVRDPNNKSSYWLSGRSETRSATEVPFAEERLSPFFAPPDGGQAGFNGDYSGLAVVGKTAHPIWSDTRNTAVVTSPSQGIVHDEDVFTDSRTIPSGGEDDRQEN